MTYRTRLAKRSHAISSFVSISISTRPTHSASSSPSLPSSPSSPFPPFQGRTKTHGPSRRRPKPKPWIRSTFHCSSPPPPLLSQTSFSSPLFSPLPRSSSPSHLSSSHTVLRSLLLRSQLLLLLLTRPNQRVRNQQQQQLPILRFCFCCCWNLPSDKDSNPLLPIFSRIPNLRPSQSARSSTKSKCVVSKRAILVLIMGSRRKWGWVRHAEWRRRRGSGPT